MARFRLRAVFALVAGTLITIGGCADNSPTGNAPSEFGTRYEPVRLVQSMDGAGFNRLGTQRAEVRIGPAGGTLNIPGGHTLDFPAGAVDKPTTIRAKVDTRYLQVDFEPHGIQFPKGREPVLTLALQGADIAPFNWLVVTYIVGDQIFEILPTDIDLSNKKATTRLRHFSGYLLSGGRSAE